MLHRLILIVFLFTVITSFGATYYVATDGNNTWNGTSPVYTSGTTGPWATISNAMQNVSGGDIIQVRGGTYEEPGWDLATSGGFPDGTDANTPTTLKNYPGETPILKFDDGSSGDSYPFFRIGSTTVRQYLLFSGLTFDFSNLASDSDRAGFDLRSIKSSTITNCIFTNAYAKTTQMLGLGHRQEPTTGASNIMVIDNEFYNWNQGVTAPTFDPHAIYAGIIKNVTIKRNIFVTTSSLDVNSAAIHLYDAGVGYPLGWDTDITVEQNWISTDDVGIFWVTPEESSSVLRNNVIICTSTTRSALIIYGIDDTLIDNNTIYGGKYGINLQTSGTTTGNILRNNIAWDSVSGDIRCDSVGEVNYWTNNISDTPYDNSGNQSFNGGITSDPLFTSAPTDLTITSESPAKDAGLDLSLWFSTDYNGATRTPPWDIGAYEYVLAQTTRNLIITNLHLRAIRVIGPR